MEIIEGLLLFYTHYCTGIKERHILVPWHEKMKISRANND